MLKRIDCKVLSVHAGFMVEISTDEIGKRLMIGLFMRRIKHMTGFAPLIVFYPGYVRKME